LSQIKKRGDNLSGSRKNSLQAIVSAVNENEKLNRTRQAATATSLGVIALHEVTGISVNIMVLYLGRKFQG